MNIPVSPLTLTRFQLYGLVFLLGSFSVATLSDLKRMTAQREFMEIWVLFFLSFLGYDIYIGYTQGADWILYAKWALIGLFVIGVFTGVFNIASGDMFACLAVLSLLPPPFILFFILALKIFQLLLGPFLKVGFGKKKSYPFLPVVTAAVVSILILGFYILEWAGL